MSLTRFREIQVEHWPDRVKLEFPTRQIGNLRWIGLLPIIFGIGFAAVPAGWIWSAAKQSFGGQWHLWELLFLLFPLLFLMAAAIPAGLGLLILCGRSRLQATRDWIKVTEIAPFVRRSRKVRVADVARLEWGDAGRGTTSGLPPFLARLGVLSARTRQGTSKLLLLGYPGEWMEEVATELSSYLKFASTGVPVQRVEMPQPLPSPELPELDAQPAGSRIKMTEKPGRVEIQVPPLGWAAKTTGLMIFSVFWLCLVAGITFMVARSERAHNLWGALLFLSIFWAVGLAMLYFSLRMACRRARLEADGSELTVTQWGVFGSTTRSWRRSEIQGLKAGESGMKINERPVLELQVVSGGGKQGFLRGRDEPELRWLATELRKRLDIPNKTATVPEAMSEPASARP